MNSFLQLLLVRVLVAALLTASAIVSSSAQLSIKEVNLDGSDIIGAPELDNSANRLNFDTVCMPGSLVKRISIRNTGSSTINAFPTTASVLSLVLTKSPTWALRRSDGTSFSNPVSELTALLSSIPAGERRDFCIRFAPINTSPSSQDNISLDLSTSPARSLGGFGTSVNAQILAVSPTSPVIFSTTQVGQQSAPQNITMRSLGKCGITISDIVVRNTDGSINPNYIVLNKPTPGTTIAAGTFSVQVVFKPVVPGAPEGRLVVINNSSQATGPDVVLRGISTGSNITFRQWDAIKRRGYILPYIVAWYNLFPTAGSFDIINRPEPGGDPSLIAPATIKKIEVTQNAAEFSLAPSNPPRPFVIAANTTQTIVVNFTPVTTLTTSVRTGELAVTYDKNGVDATVFIDLTADINEGKIEFQQNNVSITTIDFGKVRLGTASPVQTVRVVNVGTLKIDIGKTADNSDTIVYASPFVVPPGGQVPNGVRLDEISGTNSSTSFQMRFAPQASHFGPQRGHYLVESLQGGRFKRKPYDTLYAIGTGVTPNLQRKLDTVLVGQTAINIPIARSVKEFWSNQPGRGVVLGNLGKVDIDSISITSISPATAAAEFTITRIQPFSISENGTFDETFEFKPTSGAPLVHLALVRVVYDSVGNDNKVMTFVLRGDVLAPEITGLDNVIDFGEVVVSTSGAPMTPVSLLRNTGTADLLLFTPVLNDLNTPKVFALNTTLFPQKVTTGSVLPPSGLSFTPAAERDYSATFVVKTNAGTTNSTLTFLLKGKGILPGIQSKTTEIDFGKVRVGRTATDSLYVRNTAPQIPLTITGFTLSNATEFTASANRIPPFDLAAAYDAIPVSFTPQRPSGPRNTTLLITNTSQRQPSIVLKGEAVLGRIQAFEGTTTPVDTVDFGAVLLQQQSSTALALRNTGSFAYYLTRVEIVGANAGEFSLSATTPGIVLNAAFPVEFSIDMAADIAQAIAFFPTSSGEKTAELRVIGLDPVSGLPEDTASVVLRGLAADLSITGDKGESSLMFGDVLVGTTAVTGGNERFVRMTNPSKSTVAIVSVVVDGSPEFALSGRTPLLAPGTSDTVRVYFSPRAATVTAASVVVQYGTGLQQRFPISGRGVAPAAQLSSVQYTADPRTKTLAMRTDVATTTSAVVTLTNKGTHPLIVSDIRWEQNVAPWLSVDILPFSQFALQPDSSRTMTFTFAPVARDVRTARLLFTTNHAAIDAAADSSIFALAITAEGTYTAPPVLVQATLPVANGKPGDRIGVPVVLQSNDMATAGITSMVALLRYDPTLLAPHSVEVGNAATGFTASVSESVPGLATVTVSGGSNTLANGTAFTVVFDVLLGSAVSTPLVFDTDNTSVASAVPVVLSAANGMVILSEFCSSDQRIIGIGNSPILALTERPESGSMSFVVRLPADDPATLDIYDSFGRTVASPFSGQLPTGISTITADSRTLPSGLYFAVLRSGTIVRIVRFTIVR